MKSVTRAIFAVVFLPCALAAQTPLFAFHGGFWVNLHHFLYATARARLGLDAGREVSSRARSDTAGLGSLDRDLRNRWDVAVDYYVKHIARRDLLFDSALVAVNDRLSGADDRSSIRDPGVDSALVRVLDLAAPAYRAVWWPRHDAMNRRWIAELEPLLQRHGAAAAQRIARVIGHPWPDAAVSTDVTAYASWSGAYTTEGPSHITISSGDSAVRGVYAFETIFHEVQHTMDDSLATAMRIAFRDAGKRLPRDATHPFIFYTAGAVTREQFPGHVPYAERFGLWTRVSDFARMLPLLQQHWQAYIDGRVSLAEALHRIAAAW